VMIAPLAASAPVNAQAARIPATKSAIRIHAPYSGQRSNRRMRTFFQGF
jgi:hypothetical protein